MKPRHWLFLFLAILTALRLWLVGQHELSPDESYYRLWSQRLDWAYYSKGPGVALTIASGTALMGDTVFGIRFWSPLLALGTALCVFGFARKLYGETVGIWTVLTMACIPIVQAGSLVMTIDPLSIFFWSAALWTLWSALAAQGRFTWWWPLSGVLMGCGFLAKYTNVVQLVSLVILLLVSRRLRTEFRRPGFWVMLLVFAAFMFPPLYWNAQNHWITLGHLGARGGLDRKLGIHPSEFLEFFGAHLGVYSPVIFIGMLVAIFWGLKLARNHPKERFLLAFALPLLTMYFVLAFRQSGEPNWTAPAMISLGILATHFWLEKVRANARLRPLIVVGLVAGLVPSVLLLDTDVVREAGVPWRYKLDPTSRLRGWQSTAEQVQRVREKFEAESGAKVFLIGANYGLCGALSFYLPEKRAEFPGHPQIYIPESQNVENQFSFWPRYDEFVDRKDAPAGVAKDEYYTEEQGVNMFQGRNALYITDRSEQKVPTSIREGFERNEIVALFVIERGGQPLREVRIFACYNYRGQPL